MAAWYDGDGKRRHRASDAIITAKRIRSETYSRSGTKPHSHDLAVADQFEAQARQKLPAESARQGAGGELVPPEADVTMKPALRNTVANPDYVAADASRARLELADRAGVLELALDAADSANVANSLEAMLAHQLAAAHNVAMRLTSAAAMHAQRATEVGRGAGGDFHAVEAARAANAAARAMSAFQDGLLTLQKLRSGGRQVVTVQHVTVGDGGQALVAGNVSSGGRRRRRREEEGNQNGG